MFTGIIQCTGEIAARSMAGGEARFTIRPGVALASPTKGESIAVNGVCLTAESFAAASFTAYASAETLTRTALGGLTPGARVNLEQALRLDSRLGGHMVSGHVDCVARVVSVTPAGDSMRYRLAFPQQLAHLVIEKGSVALDGISLTVNACGTDFLEVNVIPETRSATTVGLWKEGSQINMETDLVGKYIARMLELRGTAGAAPSSASPGLTMDFLREHGF